MKHTIKYMAFGFMALLAAACNDSESDLLEPKLFFENQEERLEISEAPTLQYDLLTRVSSSVESQVNVSYAAGTEGDVEEYNKKNGTEYVAFDAADVTFSEESSVIESGKIYAKKLTLTFSNLDKLQEGKNYVFPVRIASASMPLVESRDITYLILSKPVRITKVLKFSGQGVAVGFTPDREFTSVTYEALIKADRFNNNNTIMGREGTLILRVGDTPLCDANRMQIAGSKEFKAAQTFETDTWYHVAFTYDQPSGKAVMYINGTKTSESTWDTPKFNLGGADIEKGGGFYIGKVNGFMWGERPFNGCMSEVRVWSVARTENQIKQNMLSVDPKSEGLEVYYKMNGDDQVNEGGYKLKDASGHNVDGIVKGGYWGGSLTVVTLDTPISIK